MRIRNTVDIRRNSLIYRITFVIIFLAGTVWVAYKYVKSKKCDDAKVVSGCYSQADGKDADYYKNLTPIADPQPLLVFIKEEIANTSVQQPVPQIAGESGIIVNLNTNKILFEKNYNNKMKIASLTKVMTAVVALEHLSLDTQVKISSKAANIGENSMGISEGESFSVEELLYGLVLPSGNDAAYALAEASAGDSDKFVEWMNIKAGQLGMTDTRFFDPSGLDDNTYSTPYDLAKLTQYALKSKEFRKIIKTKEIELTGEKHKYLYLENQTNLLRTYPGVEGVKTGFTEEAGLCLVTYAINENTELVGVVLNSIDRKGDMIMMLDHGFSLSQVKVEHHLLD